MKRLIVLLVLPAFLLVGCGADTSETDPKNSPGNTDKGIDSIVDREFAEPDYFFDYGDYDRIKGITLPNGTECVLYQVGNGDYVEPSASITCDWQPEAVPSTESDN